jgi:protein required for attachment to host cells
VTEFSFEEIRAIKYRRKRAEEEMKQIEEEKQRWKEEQAQALKRQVIDFCICIERVW